MRLTPSPTDSIRLSSTVSAIDCGGVSVAIPRSDAEESAPICCDLDEACRSAASFSASRAAYPAPSPDDSGCVRARLRRGASGWSDRCRDVDDARSSTACLFASGADCSPASPVDSGMVRARFGSFDSKSSGGSRRRGGAYCVLGLNEPRTRFRFVAAVPDTRAEESAPLSTADVSFLTNVRGRLVFVGFG